jgi:glycosyltransferase 2 family protein
MDGRTLHIIKRGLPLVGLILFGYIVHTLDLDTVMSMFEQARWPYLLCGMAVMLLFLWAKAFRHYWILRSQDIDVPPSRVMGIFFRSAFWGFISPGRVGEFSKVAYLDDYVDSKGKSIANVFIDRILDLLCIMVILIGSAAVAAIPRKWETISLAAAVLVGAMLLLVFLSRFFGRRSPGRFPGVGVFFQEFLHLKNKALLFIFSLAIWMFYYSGLYLFSKSIGLQADLWFIAFCSACSNLVALVPISVAGIGTRDALLVHLFQSASFSSEQAVVFSSFFILAYLLQMGFSYLFILFGKQST